VGIDGKIHLGHLPDMETKHTQKNALQETGGPQELQGGMHALTCMPCRAKAASSSSVGSSSTAFALVKPLFHLIKVPWFTLICRRGKLKQNPTTGMLPGFGLHHCSLLLQ
jgi:hypothetical protein